MRIPLPRLMIAAPCSGGGKTTLTSGLLQLFQNQGKNPAAFKCGPDFIDPMFHRRVAGAKSGNLDLFFTDEATACALLAKGARGCGMAFLEGVMGYYDGLSFSSTQASSYHLARATKTPVVLCLDVKGAALSLAATIQGFTHFRADAGLAGVILNRCSKGLFEALSPTLEAETGLPVLGYLPNEERFTLKSRHLGLVTAGEVQNLQQLLQALAAKLSETVDIERLWALATAAPPLLAEAYCSPPATSKHPRIAYALDEAFCFYYEENLQMLREMGAELIPFSPLRDTALPSGANGLYLGGGYPELYAEALSQNLPMRQALATAVQAGLPTVAECGGFLYLQQKLADEKDTFWPMAGVLPGQSQNGHKLAHFGYITLKAEQQSLYGPVGESIRGHEFHYWRSTAEGEAFTAQKPGQNKCWPCMAANPNLAAGFPHLYYPANPAFALRFVQVAAKNMACALPSS